MAYAIIDTAIVLAAGAMTAKLAIVIVVSLLTKLAAVYLGAMVAVHNASKNALVGVG